MAKLKLEKLPKLTNENARVVERVVDDLMLMEEFMDGMESYSKYAHHAHLQVKLEESDIFTEHIRKAADRRGFKHFFEVSRHPAHVGHDVFYSFSDVIGAARRTRSRHSVTDSEKSLEIDSPALARFKEADPISRRIAQLFVGAIGGVRRMVDWVIIVSATEGIEDGDWWRATGETVSMSKSLAKLDQVIDGARHILGLPKERRSKRKLKVLEGNGAQLVDRIRFKNGYIHTMLSPSNHPYVVIDAWSRISLDDSVLESFDHDSQGEEGKVFGYRGMYAGAPKVRVTRTRREMTEWFPSMMTIKCLDAIKAGTPVELDESLTLHRNGFSTPDISFTSDSFEWHPQDAMAVIVTEEEPQDWLLGNYFSFSDSHYAIAFLEAKMADIALSIMLSRIASRSSPATLEIETHDRKVSISNADLRVGHWAIALSKNQMINDVVLVLDHSPDEATFISNFVWFQNDVWHEATKRGIFMNGCCIQIMDKDGAVFSLPVKLGINGKISLRCGHVPTKEGFFSDAVQDASPINDVLQGATGKMRKAVLAEIEAVRASEFEMIERSKEVLMDSLQGLEHRMTPTWIEFRGESGYRYRVHRNSRTTLQKPPVGGYWDSICIIPNEDVPPTGGYDELAARILALRNDLKMTDFINTLGDLEEYKEEEKVFAGSSLTVPSQESNQGAATYYTREQLVALHHMAPEAERTLQDHLGRSIYHVFDGFFIGDPVLTEDDVVFCVGSRN